MESIKNLLKVFSKPFRTSVTISLPMDFSDSSADQKRWEMRRWCKEHCLHQYAARWVQSRDAARFDFESAEDAARFTLEWAR